MLIETGHTVLVFSEFTQPFGNPRNLLCRCGSAADDADLFDLSKPVPLKLSCVFNVDGRHDVSDLREQCLGVARLFTPDHHDIIHFNGKFFRLLLSFEGFTAECIVHQCLNLPEQYLHHQG